MSAGESARRDTSIITSLARGLKLLDAICDSPPLSVTEAAAILNVNKSTASRLLNTMRQAGLIRQSAMTDRFDLDLKILRYSQHILDNIDVRSVSRLPLKKLSVAVGETAHLCVLSNNSVVFIDQEKPNRAASAGRWVGTSEPLYCTAVGRAILCTFDDHQRDAYFAAVSMEAQTPGTLTSRSQVEEALERAKALGYAYENQEMYIGLRCIAAPVMDYRRQTIGSIGVSALVDRMPNERIAPVGAHIAAVAREISCSMGYYEKK